MIVQVANIQNAAAFAYQAVATSYRHSLGTALRRPRPVVQNVEDKVQRLARSGLHGRAVSATFVSDVGDL